uniref:Putative secreted protein n=1 Tax=Anopheles marajoara TaxID=58244 RepID=A0A2M4CA53_9DIPT
MRSSRAVLKLPLLLLWEGEVMMMQPPGTQGRFPAASFCLSVLHIITAAAATTANTRTEAVRFICEAHYEAHADRRRCLPPLSVIYDC